jgi:hypothetical protein
MRFLGAVTLIRVGTRALVLVAIVLLAGLTGVLAVGLVLTSGSQPAQLIASPAPTLDLMPMGNAHIPTTNACLLCHGTAGEVKAVPAILHPVEGWRRCLTCHTDQNLGRMAPGHEGITEEECLNCHKVAAAGPAITRPHAEIQGKACLDCHGSVAHLPSSMASMDGADCVLCHKPTDLPPPAYPHSVDSRLVCSSCHRSPEVGGLPIDHARRTDATCLLCHQIKIEGPVATPLETPVPTPAPTAG